MLLQDMLADEVLGQADSILTPLLGLALCTRHHWSFGAKYSAIAA